MQLKKIVELAPAIRALGATKLPAKIGFRVARALNVVKVELAAYDGERLKLAQALGTLSEDGARYEFEGKAAQDFTEQHEALLAEECAITLPTITPDDLGDASIEPAHLAVLIGTVIVESAQP